MIYIHGAKQRVADYSRLPLSGDISIIHIATYFYIYAPYIATYIYLRITYTTQLQHVLQHTHVCNIYHIPATYTATHTCLQHLLTYNLYICNIYTYGCSERCSLACLSFSWSNIYKIVIVTNFYVCVTYPYVIYLHVAAQSDATSLHLNLSRAHARTLSQSVSR